MDNRDNQLAQYRAAIVALIDAFRGRGRTYMTWEQQRLIRQIEGMVLDDGVPEVRLCFDSEGP
jgi:hypothetical protein